MIASGYSIGPRYSEHAMSVSNGVVPVSGNATILGNVSTGVTGFFSSISPVYAILAVLVIILVLVVLVRVVTGSTQGGGSPQL